MYICQWNEELIQCKRSKNKNTNLMTNGTKAGHYIFNGEKLTT